MENKDKVEYPDNGILLKHFAFPVQNTLQNPKRQPFIIMQHNFNINFSPTVHDSNQSKKSGVK